MLLQLFLDLLLLAALSVILAQTANHRVWSVVLLAVGSFLVFQLYEAFLSHQHVSAIFEWIPYKSLQANLHLSTSLALEKMLFPILCMAVGLIYLNAIYKSEVQKLGLNTIILLFVAAFMLLAESHDFIQLMVGSCSFTILGFYMLNQPAARQRFVFYNFLAEMALFTALAIVYSKLGTIDLAALPRYAKEGYHKDLVAMLIVLTVIAKAGLFLFQNQLLDWQNLTFNRIISMSFLTTPLAGMLLYVKLRPLVDRCDFAEPLLALILALSMLWGFFGALMIDNIKAKALYLNLMFYSFAFAWLQTDINHLTAVLNLLPAAALLNILLLMVNISSSNENYISLMGGFVRHLKFTLLLSLVCGGAFVGVVWQFYQPTQLHIFVPYLGLVIIALAHIWREIYFGTENADDRVIALLKNSSFLYWLPLLIALAVMFYGLQLYQSPAMAGALIGLPLLMALGLTRVFNRWAENEELQEADWLIKIYHTVILVPLRLLGRILWLAVDFVVIERTIIGSISETTGLMVRGLQTVQRAVWINYLLMVMIGLAIIIVTIGYYHG